MTACLHHLPGEVRRCAAGVDLATVRDAEGRLPCLTLRGISGALPCPSLQMPSVEAAAAVAGSLSKALALLVASNCPTCGEPIDGELDTGVSVVALPCHHQLKAPRRASR